MANLEKHTKNKMLEWLEPEESDAPASPRSTHVVGAYIKVSKPVSRKRKLILPNQAAPKPDVALAREPGPVKPPPKQSPLASWEHQKRLGRLPQLRAPYQYKGR